MTTRYQENQIADVIQILSGLLEDKAALDGFTIVITIKKFADLFAADNPSRCTRCWERKGTTVPCWKVFDKEHSFAGFDLAAFLKACGLGPERDPGWPDGECPTCGRTDDHTVAQCDRNLAASGLESEG